MLARFDEIYNGHQNVTVENAMFTQISRWIIALWGVMMTLLGSAMMVSPSIIIENYSLEPLDPMGWSALSGNFASLIVLLGIFALAGVLRSYHLLLRNVVLMEAIIMIGRIIAIYQHGFVESMWSLIMAEIVIALFIINHIRLVAKQV